MDGIQVGTEDETEKGGMGNPENPRNNLDARIMATYAALNTPNLKSDTHPESLRKSWVEQLRENVEHAVAFSLGSDREQTIARVFQHGDANIANLDHATFVNAFLVAFGATAKINGKREGVGVMNFQSIVSRLPRAPHEDTWNIGLEPHVSKNRDGTADETIMLDTRIPGVKLVFEGAAISQPDRDPTLRAMLAIDTGGSGEEENPTSSAEQLSS